MSFQTKQEAVRTMYLITSTQQKNRAIPTFAQLTYLQTYHNINVNNVVLYQGQLDYDIQLRITKGTINYNPEKRDIIGALILPNQI